MATTPWLLSDNFIEAVKRKFSVPIAQNLMTDDDILAFANEEMMISQVPSILQFHEEFFVYSANVTLEPQKPRYQIPSRAIGGRLRDVFYVDNMGNLFDMTRINSDDQAFFQRDAGTNNYIQKYFIENNYVVLAPQNLSNPTGSLKFTFFLRPNQLVKNERAAISNAFGKQISVDISTLVAGDTLTIGSLVFTAVSGSAGDLEFQIAGSSALTATNLASSISADGTYSAVVSNPSTSTIIVDYQVLSVAFSTTNEAALIISTDQGIKFNEIPENIQNGNIIDFLQTKPGHKTHSYDVTIPANAISSNYIFFLEDQVPDEFEVGDYICLQYECIIPQIPTDLHTSLVERTGNRIMAAIGDQIALQASDKKLGEIEGRQGTIIDNRVEGSTVKIQQRHSLLSYGRMGFRRRL